VCVSADPHTYIQGFLVGSNCQTVRAFTQALADCRRVFEMGLLDIGGGFLGEEGCEPKRWRG